MSQFDFRSADIASRVGQLADFEQVPSLRWFGISARLIGAVQIIVN